MIPTPSRPRQGFPWLGLMFAIVIVFTIVAYAIGGGHGALIAGVYALLVLAAVSVAFIVIGIVQMLRRKH